MNNCLKWLNKRRWYIALITTIVILLIITIWLAASRGDGKGDSPSITELELAACSENLSQTRAELENQKTQYLSLQRGYQDLSYEMDRLEKENENLERDRSGLEIRVEDLEGQLEVSNRALENCLNSLGAGIDPPQIIRGATHDEILTLLRQVFPNAAPRGVEQASFGLTPYSEIARFLQADDTNKISLQNSSDYVFRLIGNFSSLGWERIPVGWVKTDNESFYFVFIVWEGDEMQLFGLLPNTDQPRRIYKDTTAKFVLVG